MFRHPFYPRLGPAGITFSKGLVSGIEPVILGAATSSGGVPDAGVPISGMVNGAQGIQPTLKLDPSVVSDGDYRSWACVEVTPGPSGVSDAKTVVQVVHRGTAFLNSPTTGRQPLCLITWQNGVPAQVFHVTYFNLTCVVSTVPTGTGAGVVTFFFL